MLESASEKGVIATEKNLTMACNGTEQESDNKHLSVANNIEVGDKKKQKENLSDDMKMHNVTECCRMWMCSHCSKSFASSRALKIHEVKQHENATRHVLKCGTCHEEFEHANLLHIHMRVHHNVKVRCPRCKDIFEHPNVLKLHIKAHHSEPVCVSCGLKFDHDKLLRLHMEHYHKIGSKGTKKSRNTPSGRKTKAVAEEKTPGDAEKEFKSVVMEQENADNKNQQVELEESREDANGMVPNKWDYDEDAMSRDSSDSRDEGSSDGEAGDVEAYKGNNLEPRETESFMIQKGTEIPVGLQAHRQGSVSPPRLTAETEVAVVTTEGESGQANFEGMDSGFSPVSVKRHVPIQPQRSSVIVTTGSVSPPIAQPNASENLKRKAEDHEIASQETPLVVVTDYDASPKGSPRSPAESCAESPASTLSGDESGDSESASPKAHTTKRVTLRCNRCQEEFLSKMEYLHHLISHQKGDGLNKTQNDFIPDNRAIEVLKSSLRIKLEARRRVTFPDDVDDIQKRVSPGRASPAFCETNRRSPSADKEDLSRGLSVSCTLCSERFPDWRELKAHVESRHKKPQCSDCGLQFDHKNLLKIHMNSYHSSLDVLQCYQCGKSFGNRSEFVSHVTSHETTLKNMKETRKEHKPLRRMASAPVPGENLSRFRSQNQMFLARDRNRNGDDLDGKDNATRQGDDIPDPKKSQIDDLRTYVDRRFPNFGAFRHHKQETISSQEQGEWYSKVKANFLVGPESKTRIFLPKRHEGMERGREHFGTERRVPEELEAFSPVRSTTNNDSDAEKMPGLETERPRFSAFTAYERTERSNEVAKHPLLTRAKRDRDSLPLGGPPPLIPVVHPRVSHTLTQQPNNNVLRVHRPVARTASANSALRYPGVLPFPIVSPKWPPELERAVPPSPVRENHRDSPRDSPRDIPRDTLEVPTRESINNITKEALLQSLSLRRRASAPELGALARPLAEPQRLAVPDLPTITNRVGDSPKTTEYTESPLAASPKRSRQLNEGYQPRRKHPRDFTCHHCGIYFGHKKLLKIHLDCYHGSAQDLQCLRCEKNFSSRSEFLDHLMSHEGGDELLAIQRKRLRLDRRSSLPHEGETVIRRELNTRIAQETTLTRETTRLDELELSDIRGEFRHPLPEELKQRVEVEPPEHAKPNIADLNRESRVTSVNPSSEKNEEDDGANFCFVCGQSFSNGKKLEHHISSHAVVDKDGRYCCSLCHKTFDHHRKLEIHTRSHTGFKPHKCELCGRCFPYYSSYYYHKMTHTEDRPHKCGVCGKGFIQTRYLRSHMKTHKEQNGWASDEELNDENVPEEVRTSEGASIAVKPPSSETETKIKTEPVDQVDPSSQSELEEHDTARILCSFKQSSSVGVREQILPRETQTEGVLRDDMASGEASCTENSPSVNRTGQPTSPLESCEDGEAEGTEYNEVPGTVTNIKKETTSDANDECLPKAKKKKYKCKHCEKNFSSYSSLHVHVRIHTGQRPYSCNHCFKKFTHSSGLKRHVRCHTGEKPYPCPACPSAFADRGALKSHIRTHTGERPFVCDFCNKTFTQPSSLRVHKKTVHAHEFFDEK